MLQCVAVCTWRIYRSPTSATSSAWRRTSPSVRPCWSAPTRREKRAFWKRFITSPMPPPHTRPTIGS
ncbi:MAG: hypothetical protein AMJ88_14770 [Anaerolineae bacterium SM23_ 63]|nr:MAG: hypothetical protein AMJ88_14770 [Anaerolineae bacterium SM23_ 63]